MNDDALKLENQLCHRLYTASNALTRAYRPLLNQLNITYPQYLVMMALWEKDTISIHKLRNKTKMDGGSLTLILDKLSAHQFITIEPAEQDKRLRILKLTEKGRKLKIQAAHIPELMWCKLNTLKASEATTLINLIDKLLMDLASSE